MSKSCWTGCLVLAGMCIFIPVAGAEAGEAPAGRTTLDTWRAWQDAHPLPLADQDRAEEVLLEAGDLAEVQAVATFAKGSEEANN